MFFGPREVLTFIIERLTFHSGDVITLGSPDNPGLVEPGEEMALWYEGIGTLRKTVADSGRLSCRVRDGG